MHVVVEFVWIPQSSFTPSEHNLDACETRHLIRSRRGGFPLALHNT